MVLLRERTSIDRRCQRRGLKGSLMLRTRLPRTTTCSRRPPLVTRRTRLRPNSTRPCAPGPPTRRCIPAAAASARGTRRVSRVVAPRPRVVLSARAPVRRCAVCTSPPRATLQPRGSPASKPSTTARVPEADDDTSGMTRPAASRAAAPTATGAARAPRALRRARRRQGTAAKLQLPAGRAQPQIRRRGGLVGHTKAAGSRRPL